MLVIMKKPSNDPVYDNVLLHNSIVVLVSEILYLAFSIEHHYNITITETLSHNMRQKEKVHASG